MANLLDLAPSARQLLAGLPVTHALFILAVLAGVWVLYHRLVYPLFISPLRHVPGPKIASLTSYYLNRRYLREDGVPFIQELHRKYGPIVRVGPQEVDIDDPKEMQTVYGARSNFRKPDSAALFQNHGFPCAFSSITREEHQSRRRRSAKLYAMSSIQNNAAVMDWIRNRAHRVMDIIAEANGASVDWYTTSGMYALDIISFLVYGESLKTLDGENYFVTEGIRSYAVAAVPLTRFYNLANLLATFPFSLCMPGFLKYALSHREALESMNSGYVDKVISGESKYSPSQHIAASLVSHPDFGKSLSIGSVYSECFDHVGAGADTTAATLAYFFWTLAQPENAMYQKKIHEEVSRLPLPFQEKVLLDLPFLKSSIVEIQRLYPAGPGPINQRMSPSGQVTNLTFGTKTYTLPADTQVCIQPYSVHHNPNVYGSDVKTFRPERWMEGDEATIKKMKDSWIPYGQGARTCLGMNVALIELHLMTALVLRDYSIHVAGDADPDDMIPLWGGVLRPKGEKCKLSFRKFDY